jgi:hypothetical protein
VPEKKYRDPKKIQCGILVLLPAVARRETFSVEGQLPT